MLRKQGLTYQAICKQLGCGPNALNQQFKKRAKVIKNFSKNNGLYNSFQRESLFPIESIQHTIFQGVIPIDGKSTYRRTEYMDSLSFFRISTCGRTKMRLQYWKEHFTNKEITAGLGTYNSKLYALYKSMKFQRKEQRIQSEKEKTRTKGKKKHQLIHNFLLSPNLSKRNQLHPPSQCKMYP